MYPPPAAAMKKSTPTPLSTIFAAVFLHSGCSVWKSFFSVSMPCNLPSSRKNNRPGPQVGSADKEHMIFPPVDLRAARAASRVGKRAGSGFFTWENRSGSCVRSEEMTDLICQQHKSRQETYGQDRL